MQEMTTSPHRGGEQAPSLSSGPPIFIDREEIINEQTELCKKIDQFFSAMKLLQRAVNRKEDISSLKVDFETKQRALQKQSKSIQTRNKAQHEQDGTGNHTTIQTDSFMNPSRPITAASRNRSQTTRTSLAAAGNVSSKHSTSSQRQLISPHRPLQRPKTSGKPVASPKPLNLRDNQPDNRYLEVVNQRDSAERLLRECAQALDKNNNAELLHIIGEWESGRPEGIKESLVRRISFVEKGIRAEYGSLEKRLQQREAELDYVKKLFIEKLRDLEQNFAEIGDHIIAKQSQKEEEEKVQEEVAQQSN